MKLLPSWSARRTFQALLTLCLALPCTPGWLQAQTGAPAAEHWAYRIQPGDTLIQLAQTYLDERHGWQDLQRLNRVADPYKLPPAACCACPWPGCSAKARWPGCCMCGARPGCCVQAAPPPS